MNNFFLNITLWLYLKFQYISTIIGGALYGTEHDILKADANLGEDEKHIQRQRSSNQLLEKFYAGQRDERYTNDFYEVLKGADNFMKTSTPHQMAVAADKYGTSYGMKDRWGRRYEHYGFFDEKHKNSGKTLGDVIADEFEERRTKDDELDIMYIFNNNPIEVGLKNISDYVGKKSIGDDEIQVFDINKASKQFVFPITIMRDNEDEVNKIEELTEFLHIKKIGFEYRQLEFFIPLHFNTDEYGDDTEIFKNLVNIDQVHIRDEYGGLVGFNVDKYVKRVKYNETHEVIKFNGIEMATVDFKQ